jgi:hypothetical protein
MLGRDCQHVGMQEVERGTDPGIFGGERGASIPGQRADASALTRNDPPLLTKS